MRLPWQKRTESHYKTVLLALLAGAGAGLAVGVLTAPKSGESLRADIGDVLDEYLNTARQKSEDIRNSAASLAQRGLREVRKTKDAALDKFSDSVGSGSKHAHDAIDNSNLRTGTRA
jgi:gas vesicle protein